MDQEGVIEKQPGQQKAHRNPPGYGGIATVCGLRDVHLPLLDTSTLSSTAHIGQEDAWPCSLELAEEVGIIARGAMIPVVGSITEVQTLRVSDSRFKSE
jgi:hypothetical protein